MKKFKFKAKIVEGRGGGAYVVFPYDVEKEFGTRSRVPVKATFGGLPYTGSLAKYGQPQHILGVPKAIRERLGISPGDVVEAIVWKDEDERNVEVPAELKSLLEQEQLTPVFEKLSYTHKKEFSRWISEAKREETRNARLRKSVQLLRQGKKTPF